MTREKAITLIKAALKTMYLPKSKEYISDLGYALEIAIKALEQEPSSDMVSRGVFEQVMWERDVAIEQLKELGYELGEKIRTTATAGEREVMYYPQVEGVTPTVVSTGKMLKIPTDLESDDPKYTLCEYDQGHIDGMQVGWELALDKIKAKATSLKISYTDHDKDTYRRGVNDVLQIIDNYRDKEQET